MTEMSEKHVDELSGVETTGHEWDGIRELNNPMPRWWVWTFYATILWAIGYTVVFPSWPGLVSNFKGTSGYSSRGALTAEMDVAKAAQNATVDKIAAMPVGDIVKDKALSEYATAAGAA